MVSGRTSGIRCSLMTSRHNRPSNRRPTCGERGLYSGLAPRIQELQKGSDTLRPGGFVVFRAFDALVVQVPLELPAFGEKHVTEFVHLTHDARAFARADVEPNPRARLNDGGLGKAMNYAVVPPYGRRECGNFPENARMLESNIEGDQTTERRTTNAGMLRAGERALFAIHEWTHCRNQKYNISVAAASAEFRCMGWGVFPDACFGVVHRHDNERLDSARLNGVIRGLSNAPILPRDEGGGAIEEILSVLKIEDGEMPSRLVSVSGRRINDEVALVAEEPRVKLFVFAELSGTHGAMVTRRSFASTCRVGFTNSFTMRPEMSAQILDRMVMASSAGNLASSSTVRLANTNRDSSAVGREPFMEWVGFFISGAIQGIVAPAGGVVAAKSA